MTNNSFSIRLREARLMMKLSMDKLVARTNGAITKQSISRYEKGIMRPKRDALQAIAKALNIEGKKALVLNASIDRNVALSARNVPGVNILRAGDANTYALLNNNVIIITESSLETVNKF